MVAGGAEDEYEETSLHPPAALSLPGDELLRAPSAASIVILPVSFAVQLRFATSLLLSHHCHLPSLHRLCRSLLTSTRSSKSLLISQVGESFFHRVQSGIIFSTQSEVVQNSFKLILSEVKLRDKNRDHGGQDDHDYHDDERIMIL